MVPWLGRAAIHAEIFLLGPAGNFLARRIRFSLARFKSILVMTAVN
jgi:hypothetical protein